MINSRTKGASAERELFKIIGDMLGIKVERNLEQTRDGGADTIVGEWALEVKRQEILHIDDWWEQTTRQATIAFKQPMLIYRKSRQPWRVRVLAEDYLRHYGAVVDVDGCLEMALEQGVALMGKIVLVKDGSWQDVLGNV